MAGQENSRIMRIRTALIILVLLNNCGTNSEQKQIDMTDSKKALEQIEMFAQRCGDMLLKVLSSFCVLVSGTGRGFETAPLCKHKRYGSIHSKQ